MSDRLDKTLEALDAGLQSSTETGYGTDYRPDRCSRCQRHPLLESGDLCPGCRAFLLGDEEQDPRRAGLTVEADGWVHGYLSTAEWEVQGGRLEQAGILSIVLVDADTLALVSDLTTDEARAAVGQTMAMIEPDCADSWPTCPRSSQLICDCRLRAVRACNALTRLLSSDAFRELVGERQLAAYRAGRSGDR